MLKKTTSSSNNIRATMLVVSISLFLLFTTIFFISINYFNAIQQRISTLITLTNYKDSGHEKAFKQFQNAENNFRKYSIDLKIENYKNYQKNIQELEKVIIEIIGNHQKDSVNQLTELNKFIKHNKYLILQSKIKEIKALSPMTDSIQSILYKSQFSKPPSTQNLNFDVKKVIKTPQIQEKSFFDKLFKKSTPSTPPVIDEEAVKLYNKELENFSQSNNKHFNLFKSSYESLRKSERELLSKHFTLLYSVYQLLQEIKELQVNKQKEMLQREHEDLLIQSDKLTWQTILGLIFIFILIFIMIFYQFRNSYYEKQLIEEQRYAAKLASEKSDILAEISHEIRTPINSLIGIIDLLRKRSNIYSKKEQLFLDSAYSNITNTSRTINDILNLSKMDYMENVDHHDFDISDLAHDIYQVHKSQAELKGIDLEVIVEEYTFSIIHSDEFKIRQILTNLISNGIKYTIKGKVSCYIKINELNNLHIQVIDSGLGIPFSMQPNIFKKYFTRKDENKLSNGIGLGLYITEKLIKQLRGNITFTSRENSGTTFNVEIPIPEAKKSNKINLKYKSLADFSNDIAWLLVDDNILNILYLKQFFQSFKIVKTASNGLEALEILKSFTPHIIITDINMPIMTGDELLFYARQIPELSGTKIIATSSDYDQIRELEEKRSIYFDNVIIKPFTEKDVVKIINQTLSATNSTL